MADQKKTGGTGDQRPRDQGEGRNDEGFAAAPSTGTGGPDALEGSILEGESTRRGVSKSEGGNTGAGAEAAEGVHAVKGKRPEEPSAVTQAHGEPGRGEGAGLSGSEPLRHRETEHKSGYGGEKDQPRNSSDQR